MTQLSKELRTVIDALNEIFPSGAPYEAKKFLKSKRLEKSKINMDSLTESLLHLESIGFISDLQISEAGIPEHLVICYPVRAYKEFAAMRFAEKAKYAILGAGLTIVAEIFVAIILQRI